MIRLFLKNLVLCLFMLATPALAVAPDEILDDPALEARARTLSAGLRCMVCQNQSIDDSDAPLAKDLRVLVRERLVAGDSNEEVVDYLVSRYGEFVLLKPRFAWHTLMLWAAGPLVLMAGAVAVATQVRRKRAGAASDAETVPLSEDEQHKLRGILKSGADT